MTEEIKTLEIEKQDKGPINISLKEGIVPGTYRELLQFAALYKDSGLAPKSFTTIQQLAIGIGMCVELKRPILTGIQDMAVINGKVSVYGDAGLALVRASNLLEYITEKEEGEPFKDNWKFTCTLKRKGMPEPRVGTWTWEESKRAGFDDPKQRDGSKDIYSPWRRFTRRMMQFKARNFPLRDEFGDVLRGITFAEDAQDIIDVTPIPVSLSKGGEQPERTGDIYGVKDPEQGKEAAPGPEQGPPSEKKKPGPKPGSHRTPRETEKPQTEGYMDAVKRTIVPAEETPPEEAAGTPAEGQGPPTKDKETDIDPDTVAFLTEAEQYEDALEGTGKWPKILKAFNTDSVKVESAKDVPIHRRASFLTTCKSQLDIALKSKE
jgi:hypothetical protein